MKTESPKKRRAKRARARQRPRYDLRHRYREQDLPIEHIGLATIDDLFTPAGYLDAEGNLGAEARLAPAQHHDGTVAEGAPGWTPPRRPTMTVFVALKDDPVGRMHSRHQIDEAQYQGARAYQQTADRAMLGAVRSVDLTKTKVSGVISVGSAHTGPAARNGTAAHGRGARCAPAADQTIRWPYDRGHRRARPIGRPCAE